MTNHTRLCPAGVQGRRCTRVPPCEFECLYAPDIECCTGNCNQGRDCKLRLPIVMFEAPWQWLTDLMYMGIYWAGTIAVITLVAVAAGIAVGFFG